MIRTAMVFALVCGVVSASTQAPAPAPAPRPTFEVASIKRREPPFPTRVIASVTPGGAYNRTATAAALILYAYNLQDYQLVGGPDWLRTEPYDIAARAGREVATPELRLMLQSLLEDRFRLRTRTEQREMPLYKLVMAREDGRLGPNIKKSDDDCQRLVQRTPDVPAGAATVTGCGPVETLARMASRVMAAPVTDATGLVGQFESSFYYSSGGAGIVAETSIAPNTNAPAFPTALQEQLGLKLESTRGRVDVLVIDTVERPTPD